MRSFERINYAVRPNKHIERRLIFEALQTAEPYLPVSKYRYIGLGSMWFADFVLAHKLLHISDLLSIEEEPEDAQRAAFNKPFRNVQVVDGHTSAVLPTIGLPERRALLWLDYDGGLEPSTLYDLGVVCREAPNGSVVLVTVNAHAPRPNKFEVQEKKIREVAGALVPPNLPPTFFDAVPGAFPNNVAQILFVHLASCLKNAGRPERSYPLFNFYYADGAPMITVGVVIADAAVGELVDKWKHDRPFKWVSGVEQFVVDVPHLTPREKLLFDQLLPDDVTAIGQTLASLKLPFNAKDVARYARFYARYPIFGEFYP